MYVRETFVAYLYNVALQNNIVKLDIVHKQHVLRLVLARQMRIYCKFPFTARYHLQVLIIETKILVAGFVLYYRAAILNRHYCAVFAKAVYIYRSLLHKRHLLQTHFSKVRAKLVYRVPQHKNLDIVALAYYRTQKVHKQHKLIGQIIPPCQKLVKDYRCDIRVTAAFFVFLLGQTKPVTKRGRVGCPLVFLCIVVR